MLPVVAGKAETRRQILIYTSLLVPLSFAPLVLGMAGIAYGAVVAVMGACFLLLAVRVLHERGGRAARRMFRFSILYLFVLFAALIIEHALATALAQRAGAGLMAMVKRDYSSDVHQGPDSITRNSLKQNDAQLVDSTPLASQCKE